MPRCENEWVTGAAFLAAGVVRPLRGYRHDNGTTTRAEHGLAGQRARAQAGESLAGGVPPGTLASVSLMLMAGTLGDLCGRKKLMLIGVVMSCGGSVLSALAANTAMLVAGRVVMGVAVACSEPGTLSMIRHL